MRRLVIGSLVTSLGVGLAASTSGAPRSGAVGQPDDMPAPISLDGAKCDAWEVDYDLVAGTRFRVSETVMKAGDGTYDVGPGRVRIRFRDAGGKPGPGTADLLKLEVTTKFTVESNVVGLKTTVKTDAVSKNTPGKCGVIAQGQLQGNRLAWLGAANGYRSDGKLFCEGVMCGKMGAPPAGESPMTMGPYPVTYQPFVFSDGVKRFTMPFSEVARSSKPKQVTHLELAGVETSRKCVTRPACK